MKNIVDPSSVDTLSFPKQFNELVQILDHHYLNLFDNVSFISNEISDILCRAVTGAGIIKRGLYKNDKDIVYKFRRGIGINGINLATTKPDFLDRSPIINLKRIEKNARKREEEIDKEFEDLKPSVLGYIFDILVKVLKYKQDHQSKTIKDLPRMADFAGFAEIIARCIGYEDKEFINAYEENIDKQNDEVIEASPVAEALLLFLLELDKDNWEGTPTELYKNLEDIIDQIKPGLTRSNLWPKASNSLTSKINEVVPNLKERGIEITTGEKNREGNRVIKIERIQKDKNNETNKINEDDDNNNEHAELFNPFIHRLGNSDNFDCDKCSQKGDIHFMKKHVCITK